MKVAFSRARKVLTRTVCTLPLISRSFSPLPLQLPQSAFSPFRPSKSSVIANFHGSCQPLTHSTLWQHFSVAFLPVTHTMNTAADWPPLLEVNSHLQGICHNPTPCPTRCCSKDLLPCLYVLLSSVKDEAPCSQWRRPYIHTSSLPLFLTPPSFSIHSFHQAHLLYVIPSSCLVLTLLASLLSWGSSRVSAWSLAMATYTGFLLPVSLLSSYSASPP